MQAQGNRGELLERSLQELILVLQDLQSFSLFTNTDTWSDITLEDIQNEILQIGYTNEQMTPNQIVLKAKKIGKSFKNYALVCISDFQKKPYSYDALIEESKGVIQLQPIETTNASIDSVWINLEKPQELNIQVSHEGTPDPSSLSIFNNETLLGRSTINFEKEKETKTFKIPKDKAIKGSIVISDNGLQYDNTYFFSVHPPSKTKVISIGKSNQEFLTRIYTEENFEFTAMPETALNFAELSKANTIILNEVSQISQSLENLLEEFKRNDGKIIVIPANDSSKTFLKSLEKLCGVHFEKLDKTSKKITEIVFEQPTYRGVFTKSIDNFQYPEVQATWKAKIPNALLKYQNGETFLGQRGNIYLFSASLKNDINNFINSPLVVPTFYKMGIKETNQQALSYIIGKQNEFTLPIKKQQDHVIQLKSSTESFIPLQQAYTEHIRITTNELPKTAGNYSPVNTENKAIGDYSVSFNFGTSESELSYVQLSEGNNISNDIVSYFSKTKAGFQTTELWKWFIIFALIFLVIEILLLKFLK